MSKVSFAKCLHLFSHGRGCDGVHWDGTGFNKEFNMIRHAHTQHLKLLVRTNINTSLIISTQSDGMAAITEN